MQDIILNRFLVVEASFNNQVKLHTQTAKKLEFSNILFSSHMAQAKWVTI